MLVVIAIESGSIGIRSRRRRTNGSGVKMRDGVAGDRMGEEQGGTDR